MNKYILLGDSITEGIGGRRENYAQVIAQENQAVVCNMSLTGSTVEYIGQLLEKIKDEKPTVIVIMYGSVDVQFRPNMEKNRFHVVSMLPRHYREIKGILNPRPYYSSHLLKRIVHHVDNIARAMLKKIVVATQGYHQYYSVEAFQKCYQEQLNKLVSEVPEARIICVSTVPVDESIYPGTNREYQHANAIIQQIANDYKQACYVDVYTPLQRLVKKQGWNAAFFQDHFHPNSGGYLIIGQAIANAAKEDNYERLDAFV